MILIHFIQKLFLRIDLFYIINFISNFLTYLLLPIIIMIKFSNFQFLLIQFLIKLYSSFIDKHFLLITFFHSYLILVKLKFSHFLKIFTLSL